jgi:hypothetical protein
VPWRGSTLSILAPLADLVNHRAAKGGGARLRGLDSVGRKPIVAGGGGGGTAGVWGPGVGEGDVGFELVAGSNFSRGQVPVFGGRGVALHVYRVVLMAGALGRAPLRSAPPSIPSVCFLPPPNPPSSRQCALEQLTRDFLLCLLAAFPAILLPVLCLLSTGLDGQEVFVSYGAKCNDELLLDYGFSSREPSPPCSWDRGNRGPARSWASTITRHS